MSLVDVVVRLLVGALALVLGGAVTLVGWRRFGTALRGARATFRSVAPHACLLAAVLLVNRLARHRGQELSWAIGWNITGLIYAIEGRFVGWVQSFATPELTAYFSFMYLYGYVFLTGFPFVAYFALTPENTRPLKETVVAYSLNYFLGLVCYTLFISFGPRNLIPDAVESLLYTTYPGVQLLTSEVNSNTNVFPSLHASLSVTAMLLARRTADVYRAWYYLSIPLAVSIAVATMYLGIHWATDVVAGVLLGALSVRLASRHYELRRYLEPYVERPLGRWFG